MPFGQTAHQLPHPYICPSVKQRAYSFIHISMSLRPTMRHGSEVVANLLFQGQDRENLDERTHLPILAQALVELRGVPRAWARIGRSAAYKFSPSLTTL